MEKSELKQSNSLFSFLHREDGNSSLIIVLLIVVGVTGMVMAQNNRTDFIRLKAEHRSDSAKGKRANMNALTVAKAMLNYLNPPTSTSWTASGSTHWNDMPAFFPDPYYLKDGAPFSVDAVNYSASVDSLWSFEQGKFSINDFSSSLLGRDVKSVVSFDGVHYDDPTHPNLMTSIDLSSNTNIFIRGYGDKNYKNEATIELPKPPPAYCSISVAPTPKPTNYDCDWCNAPPEGYDTYVDEGVEVSFNLRVYSVILSAELEGEDLALPYPITASVRNRGTALKTMKSTGSGGKTLRGSAVGPYNSCSASHSIYFVPPPGPKPTLANEEILVIKTEKESILAKREAARAAYLERVRAYYASLRAKAKKAEALASTRADKYRKAPPRSIQRKYKKKKKKKKKRKR